LTRSVSEFAKPSGEIAPHTLGAAEAFAAGYTQRIPRRIELPKQAEIEPNSQTEAAVARLFTGGTKAEYLGRGYFRLKGQSGFLVTPSVSGDFHSPVASLVALALASNPVALVLGAAGGTAYAAGSALTAIGYIAEAELQVRAHRSEGQECADLPAPQCLECFGFTQYSDAINSGWQGASAGVGAAVVGSGAVLGVLAMTGPPGWLVIAAVGVTVAAVIITVVCVSAALHANMKQEEAERICVR
jgi:hypothetical protein